MCGTASSCMMALTRHTCKCVSRRRHRHRHRHRQSGSPSVRIPHSPGREEGMTMGRTCESLKSDQITQIVNLFCFLILFRLNFWLYDPKSLLKHIKYFFRT